ncbi:Cof-type HAD-IIB family hydrolase [Endozoicomonas arenosclerae]|uniref:Cof-type HAD-IIB family hydrolase n=1 Tax=Endozoicomonas arenosclerae TaxID=1633495 RepID=UPI00078659B7|nr:Cof-type HAD-IIB family hydrolase [Endozoicomonas arenosclerae]
MYPVVVSDLDGTLLNDQHELAPRTKDVIRRLSSQGIRFVFATGRHYLDVEEMRAQLDIDMYTITSNGARAHNPQGEMIVSHDLNPEYIQQLISLGRKYSDTVFLSVYSEDNWFVEQHHEDLLKFHKDTGFSYTMQNLDTIPVDKIIKVFFIAKEHEELLDLEKDIHDAFGDSVNMAFSLDTCLEIMAPAVSKGAALEEVMKLKGLELKDAVAFGDGMNDVEMLEVVGKGLVMGNATERLKARLPDHEVIGECNDDAVANFLDQQYPH